MKKNNICEVISKIENKSGTTYETTCGDRYFYTVEEIKKIDNVEKEIEFFHKMCEGEK